MKPYQERVVAEKKELDARIEKLGAFLVCDEFRSLTPADERELLMRQHVVMEEYSAILGKRIAAFA